MMYNMILWEGTKPEDVEAGIKRYQQRLGKMPNVVFTREKIEGIEIKQLVLDNVQKGHVMIGIMEE